MVSSMFKADESIEGIKRGSVLLSGSVRVVERIPRPTKASS